MHAMTAKSSVPSNEQFLFVNFSIASQGIPCEALHWSGIPRREAPPVKGLFRAGGRYVRWNVLILPSL